MRCEARTIVHVLETKFERVGFRVLEAEKGNEDDTGVREEENSRLDAGFGLDKVVSRVIPVSCKCKCLGKFLFESA